MSKIRKILAPTDLSELSRAGVRYALELAASEGAEVIVYHVVQSNETTPYYGLEDGFLIGSRLPTVDEILEQDYKLLDKFLRDNFADLLPKAKVRHEVAVGTPYDKIMEKAEEENADMIVMSSHGRSNQVWSCNREFVADVFFGSVTEKIVRLAACPVLTVRPRKEEASKQAAA